ncbi:MAG: hypothetical protein ACFCVE_02220 [Phycisphaerae bacterium]
MRPGRSLVKNNSPGIRSPGSRKTLESNLSFDNPPWPSGAINMGNYNGPSGKQGNFGPGEYYFQNFNLPSGKTLHLNGPVTFHINGNCSIDGIVNTHQKKPANLKIRMLASAGVNFNGGNERSIYADIYAPRSPMNVNGNVNLYGAFIVKQLNLSSGADITIDLNLVAEDGDSLDGKGGSHSADGSSAGSGGEPGSITLVR